MDNFTEAIMGHLKKIQSLNPQQISLIEDRLAQIVSQFHTPDHPPYAAMIQSAILELNEKGGSTENSIAEFINRHYDDLPWAHCSLLKHHLGLLSEHGEIIVTRGCRYSLCGAGSKSSSMKGGKKHRRKKWRWRFEKKQNKKVKLKTMIRSQNENEIEVIEDPSHVKDENALVAGNAVIETECQKDGLQTPKQDDTIGTVLLQLTDGRENDICGRTKPMDIDPPLLVTDKCDNRVGIEQKQETCQLKLHEPCDLHSMDLHVQNPNGDAIQELKSPERPPGFEFVGVETRNSQDCLIVNSHQLHMSKLIATEANLLPAPTISSPPSEKKEQHRNPQPKLVAEHLEKDDRPCSLFPMQEKKKGKHRKRRQFDQMLEKREILLALPDPQKGSPLLRDRPMQDGRLRRQLRRWSVDHPVISHMKKVSSSTENSGKYPPVEVTSDIEESLQKVPSESTAITRRRAKVNSSQRESGGQLQPMPVSPCSSANVQQDEGSISQRVYQLVELSQQEKETSLRIYRRRGRSAKAKTDTIEQDELPPADVQKQQEEEPPISKESTSEAALTKEELMPPNHEDHSVKEHKVEPSEPQPRGKPSKRKLVVNKGEDDQPSMRKKLKKSFDVELKRSKRNISGCV